MLVQQRANPSYGFQTTTKLRLVLSVALVDAAIKDSDIVSVFRALHNLMLRVISNPFLSLPRSFHATPAKAVRHTEESLAGLPPKAEPSGEASSPAEAKADTKESGEKKGEEGAQGAERQCKTQVSPNSLQSCTGGIGS